MYFDLKQNGPYYSLVVCIGNIRVGMANFKIKKYVLTLNQIDVFEKYQNKGIGTHMIQYIETLASSKKIKKICGVIMQSSDSKKLVRWYKRCGYDVTETNFKKILLKGNC